MSTLTCELKLTFETNNYRIRDRFHCYFLIKSFHLNYFKLSFSVICKLQFGKLQVSYTLFDLPRTFIDFWVCPKRCSRDDQGWICVAKRRRRSLFWTVNGVDLSNDVTKNGLQSISGIWTSLTLLNLNLVLI